MPARAKARGRLRTPPPHTVATRLNTAMTDVDFLVWHSGCGLRCSRETCASRAEARHDDYVVVSSGKVTRRPDVVGENGILSTSLENSSCDCLLAHRSQSRSPFVLLYRSCSYHVSVRFLGLLLLVLFFSSFSLSISELMRLSRGREEARHSHVFGWHQSKVHGSHFRKMNGARSARFTV